MIKAQERSATIHKYNVAVFDLYVLASLSHKHYPYSVLSLGTQGSLLLLKGVIKDANKILA